MASGVTPVIGFPVCFRNRSTKCATRRGISSVRSPSGGRETGS
jgi:hypothetical protein